MQGLTLNYGIYVKLKTFILSSLTRNFNDVNLHNLEKFQQIKKICSIFIWITSGDYIEFGIFKGNLYTTRSK